MYITATILLSCIAAQQPELPTVSKTPATWLNSRIESVDRKAMEQMISFAPPPIPENASWILPQGGEAVSWEDLRGKVVVVQSWSNAVPAGRLAISAVTKAVSKLKAPDDIVLITIHTPEEYKAARKYMVKKSLYSPTVVDSTGEICNSLGFYKDPTNLVIGRNGAVQHVGLRTRGLTLAIKALLKEPYDPDTVPETFSPSEKPSFVKAKFPKHNSNYGKAKNMQGKQAPKFYVKEWLSDPVEVSGKVRIVEFWATWCAPCRKSIPHLNDIAKHFGDDVAVVGVSNEDISKVRPFMKKIPMNYGVAVDPQRKMQSAVACTAIPLAMVISSDGTVRWQGNPIGLTIDIVQQVLSADRGEGVPIKRGRWDTQADHG